MIINKLHVILLFKPEKSESYPCRFTLFEYYMRLWMEKENVDSGINPKKSGKNKVKKYQ